MISMVKPAILMSICRAVIPRSGPGDLEVHVPVVVFGPGDVGQDGILVSLP